MEMGIFKRLLRQGGSMKKWHLEEVLHLVSSRKLILPDLGQTAVYRPTASSEFRKESILVRSCRQVAAFLIRCF